MQRVEKVAGYLFSAHTALLAYLLVAQRFELLLIYYTYVLGLATIVLLASIAQTYGKYFPLLLLVNLSTFYLSLKITLDILSWAPLIATILGALIGAETQENIEPKNIIRAIAGLTTLFLVLHILA